MMENNSNACDDAKSARGNLITREGCEGVVSFSTYNYDRSGCSVFSTNELEGFKEYQRTKAYKNGILSIGLLEL